jgi:hypothetical protein
VTPTNDGSLLNREDRPRRRTLLPEPIRARDAARPPFPPLPRTTLDRPDLVRRRFHRLATQGVEELNLYIGGLE